MKYNLVFVLVIISTVLFGQNPSIIKVFSENKAYMFKTIPFSFQPDDTLGKTEVFRVNDLTPVYTINRSFSNTLAVLSNDGNSILELAPQLILNCYQSGKLTNQINLKDYHKFGSQNCKSNLFYQEKPEKANEQYLVEIDSIASRIPVFAHNDTLYFITCTDSVLTFRLLDGRFIKAWTMYDNHLPIPEIANVQYILMQELKAPNWGIFPPLADGSNFEARLAQYLNMTIDKPQKKDFKYYKLSLRCVINSEGKCEDIKPVFELHSKEDSIWQFVSNRRFDVSSYPKELDKWVFQDFLIFMRKSNVVEAHQELKAEQVDYEERYNKNLTADTINNIYIPKDLNDCIVQLDLILTAEKKDDILANGIETGSELLGLWIRNYWGLWSGSRLQVYLKSKGFNNAEDMSAYILDGYYRHLKEKAFNSEFK
jgi:hypothetical protein